MKVIIKSHIDIVTENENEAVELAKNIVSGFDDVAERVSGEEIVTKLYYIVPKIGKILVVVDDEDREILGADSNVVASTNISSYPLEKLPSKILEYRELIIKKDSSISSDDMLNVAQAISEKTADEVFPVKLPIVKLINYRDEEASKLVIPSVFGEHIFESVSGVVNAGDADIGKVIISELSVPDVVYLEEFDTPKTNLFEFKPDNTENLNYVKRIKLSIKGEKLSSDSTYYTNFIEVLGTKGTAYYSYAVEYVTHKVAINHRGFTNLEDENASLILNDTNKIYHVDVDIDREFVGDIVRIRINDGSVSQYVYSIELLKTNAGATPAIT